MRKDDINTMEVEPIGPETWFTPHKFFLVLCKVDTVFPQDIIIDPFVRVGHKTKFGSDCSIGSYTQIGDNVTIGNNVTIKDHCRIDNNVTIGDNVNIRGSTVICSDMFIEGDNDLGHGLYCTNHPRLSKFSDPVNDITTPPRICLGACVGANVTLMPGVKIGRYSLIGAHCVVTKDIPDNEVWAAKGTAAEKWR